MIKIKKCVNAGTVCPSQWECDSENGELIDVRYRCGTLSVRKYGDELFHVDHGGNLDGLMDTNKMIKLTKDILDFSNAEIVEE